MSEKRSKYDKMEIFLGALSWIAVVIILLFVLFTTLHLNTIINWPMFGNYLFLEISLFIGLSIWAIRFYVNSKRYTSYFKYSVFSFVFAVIQLIFILFTVY
ncbi:MAG: hypothetical protein GX829_05425 [Clostridium sp.]|jgi:hypothetical protein|nr:hypothetical protein [Clostridium sp.]